MVKWAFILTVMGLSFLNVWAQTNTTSSEDSELPTITSTIGEESPQTPNKEETPVKNDTGTTTTSTFPPLVRSEAPHDHPPAIETRNPSHEAITPTEKVVTNTNMNPKQDATTAKPNSSNMLLSSITLLIGSSLIWNINY